MRSQQPNTKKPPDPPVRVPAHPGYCWGDGARLCRPELARHRQLRHARSPGFPHLWQARQPRARRAVAQKQPTMNGLMISHQSVANVLARQSQAGGAA